ncbi:MAG: sigma-70 family RNA polymerase sigma factor [Planctomycetaceae bacterium]
MAEPRVRQPMMSEAIPMCQPVKDEASLLDAIRRGDSEAVGDLFELHRQRLLRMVHLRLDSRVRQRIDATDVLQETFLVMSRRIQEFLDGAGGSLFVWLRLLAAQKIVDLHREHLQAQKRDASREVSIFEQRMTRSTSDLLATQLVIHSSSPSQKVMKAERRTKLSEMLMEIEELDRDILVLRHFEQLSNREVAETLEMNESSVSTRHVRALIRLKELLRGHEEFGDLISGQF